MDRYTLMFVVPITLWIVGILVRAGLINLVFHRLSPSSIYGTKPGFRMTGLKVMLAVIVAYILTALIITAVEFGIVRYGMRPIVHYVGSFDALIIVAHMLQYAIITIFLVYRLPLPAHVSKGAFLATIAGVNALVIAFHWILASWMMR